MSNTHEFSDVDDSFAQTELSEETVQSDTVVLSSDNESNQHTIDQVVIVTSDEEELPDVSLRRGKSNTIRKLFPNTTDKGFTGTAKPALSEPKHDGPQRSVSHFQPLKEPGYDRVIGGVKVNLPVEPYGCQVALMSKVITAIKTEKNCLLESPTGSGKTLALLCAALAWQRHERARMTSVLAEKEASKAPELKNVPGGMEYLSSVPNVNFEKSIFGEKSIYDSPIKNTGNDSLLELKRQEPLQDHPEEHQENGLVKIHEKRRRLYSPKAGECSKMIDSPSTSGLHSTPQKNMEPPTAETPESVRTPTIYYGARTHKQIQQVIKEFKRTSYCGEAKMTLLSSRDYSCIRDFDRKLWSSKNDMCRECVKKVTPVGNSGSGSNCKFYDNRQALNHATLPPAFDLDELVAVGQEINACPYYAARGMASQAHIVFCPYNYLIEPSIRSSMKIELAKNIVVIDEAHNIEDICRDAASFTFSREQLQAAITELEKACAYIYSGSEIMGQVEKIVKALKTWDDWFVNQTQLVANKPVNNNEAVHAWQAADFVQTLDNHNIGRKHFPEFKQCAEVFCQRLREDPRTLVGVTQATGSLVENINTVLSYLFRCDGEFMDDFKPLLVRMVYTDHMSDAVSWRSSEYNQRVLKDQIELRLLCMNPAVVFGALKAARCVILASGTLTPLASLYSELGTEFPLKVSPNHVIPRDRVWIGTLSTGPGGERLECKSASTQQASVQDALGAAVLHVCHVTPHGVLCFMPSYQLMNRLVSRWKETGLWDKIELEKNIFMERRNVRDHNDIMEDYYKYVETSRGAVLFAVFRGKVSEGMDFKDRQARAVITIGIPYPNTYDPAVKEKMAYNDKYEKRRGLLRRGEWLRVQAYRALNQAVGRCVRHRRDWGAVLLVDARFTNAYYTEHLSGWVRNFLNNNHHTFDSLVNSANSLETFMQTMTIRENEGEDV